MTMIPNLCLALSDACTNPSEYTVERRCYVTDATWQRAPYKYILKMRYKSDGLVFCTANMVSGQIVTAKHCVEDKDISDIEFIAFNGRKITIKYSGYESFFPFGAYNEFPDIVFLTPSANDEDFIKNNSINVLVDADSITNNSSFVTAGFGGLKILSDKEIKLFQQAYAKYLEDTGRKQKKYDDILEQPVVDDGKTANLTMLLSKNFYKEIDKYLKMYGLDTAEEMFRESQNMKASICVSFDPIDSSMVYGRCKVWHGNSGGGVYRVSNVLNKDNMVSANLCGGTLCGFLGVVTDGLSFVSVDPDRHLSPMVGIEPVLEIKYKPEFE